MQYHPSSLNHRHITNCNQYLIVHQERSSLVAKEVIKEEYKHYQSFKSIQIRESSIYDRYIEHRELNEAQLYRKDLKEHTIVIDKIYHNDLVNGLYKEIFLLPKITPKNCKNTFFETSIGNVAKDV